MDLGIKKPGKKGVQVGLLSDPESVGNLQSGSVCQHLSLRG